MGILKSIKNVGSDILGGAGSYLGTAIGGAILGGPAGAGAAVGGRLTTAAYKAQQTRPTGKGVNAVTRAVSTQYGNPYYAPSTNGRVSVPTFPSGGYPQVPLPPGYGTTRATNAPGGVGAAMYDDVGRPMVTQVGFRSVAACGKGYVAVDMDGDGVADACVLKAVARAAGLWKSRRRPPISAGDWHKLQVADRVTKKAKVIAGKAGFTCAKKGSHRGKR